MSYSKPNTPTSHRSTTTHPCTFLNLSSPRRKLVIFLGLGSRPCPARWAKPSALINPGFLLTSPCNLLPFFRLLTLMIAQADKMPGHDPTCSIIHCFLCSWDTFYVGFMGDLITVISPARCSRCLSWLCARADTHQGLEKAIPAVAWGWILPCPLAGTKTVVLEGNGFAFLSQ